MEETKLAVRAGEWLGPLLAMPGGWEEPHDGRVEQAAPGGMAILVIDAQGLIRHCSGGAADFLGRPAREMMGEPLIGVIPDLPLRRDTPGYNLAFLILNYGPEVWHRGNVRTADGRQLPVEMLFSMMELGHHQWVMVGLRVPRPEVSARDYLERLTTRMDSSPDAAVITDPAGIIEYINPAYANLSGYSRREAVGQSQDILKSGLHPPAFYKKMWDALSAGRTHRAVFAHRAKNGRVFYLDETIRPFMDRHSRITHYVMDGQDISHHILAQGEIQYGAHAGGLSGFVSRLI